MIDVLLIILSSVGCTLLISRSHILKPFREYITRKSTWLGIMVSCYQCIGFWSGMICYLLVSFKIDILVYALIASLVGYLLNKKNI